MFGSNPLEINNTSGVSDQNSVLKSGYDPTVVKGASGLRKDFVEALELNPKEVREEKILAAAKKGGQLKGLNEMVKRWSKEKLNVGRQALNLYGTVLSHTNQSVGLEVQWERTTQRNLESLSTKLLDMGITQNQHQGFATYCDKADKLLKF
jgi:hypothetical protein